jgi:hypothetical protein
MFAEMEPPPNCCEQPLANRVSKYSIGRPP